MTTAYHFTGDKLRDGTPIPPIGFVLEHPGPIKMCAFGLHWSREPFDALAYAPGPLLHKVRVDMIAEEEKDKGVSKKRTILQTIDATELMRKFARQQALSVIHLWNAPQVVKEYLETGEEKLRAAAWDAARAAAWDAARAAARAAAWDAARAAAWDAARDAAWAAAWDAARDAAWAAARDAAGEAARGVAWDAARDAARKQFNEMVYQAFNNCNGKD